MNDQDKPILDFDFSNTSDIDLPPTAGPNRQLRFDDAPTIEDVQRQDSKTGGLVTRRLMRFRGKIADGGQGTYSEEENNRMIFVDCDLADPRQQILAKRIFLAARINPAGMSFHDASQALVGKTIGVNYTHANSKPGDKRHPCIYGNVRDVNVPADMLTNIPGAKTPSVPQVTA